MRIKNLADDNFLVPGIFYSESKNRNTVKQAVYLPDVSGKVLSWNKEVENIEGFSTKAVAGNSFSVFFTSDDIIRGAGRRFTKIATSNERFESLGRRLKMDECIL